MSELRRQVLRSEQGPDRLPEMRDDLPGRRARRARRRKEEEDEDELAAPAGVELVSLDEVEAGEEKAAEPAVDDIDVEDDEAGRRRFLEEEEEDDDDVTR